MRFSDTSRFVGGTADPAFAVDGMGLITAWNDGAAEAFGMSAAEAVGKVCHEVVCGRDADGGVCSSECPVKIAAKNRHPIHNFDLRIAGLKKTRWFNVSVILVDVVNSEWPHAIHMMRPIESYERLEEALRDLLRSAGHITGDGRPGGLASANTLAREASLTERELEILRLVARSETTAAIAERLQISPKTVDNHLQHILGKLNAHTRLQAVLRTEHAGLL